MKSRRIKHKDVAYDAKATKKRTTKAERRATAALIQAFFSGKTND